MGKKMGSLQKVEVKTEPDTASNISLLELLNISSFQGLLDSFFELTGMPAAILDLEGKILIASRWQKICTDFHRKNPVTASRCLESDTRLADQLAEGKKFNIYKCKNGLIDVATPIIIENMHLGNLFAGQFLLEPPDIVFFTRQAEEFDFNKELYLDALSEVPVLSDDKIKKTMGFLTHLTVVIGTAGIDKKKQFEYNRNISIMEKRFSESLISSLPGVMYVFDQFGHFIRWNRNFEMVTGYSKNQILEMNPLDFIAAEDKSRVKKTIEKVFQEGIATVEAGFSTINGEIIPYLFTGYKYIQEDINYLIGVGLDIKKRVKTEKIKENLIKKLQETLSEVKRLSGLLPICASCKKIRDDSGYWNQIESYIHKHSEAKFTHGMCPECSDRLYGDKDWYIKMKQKKKK